MPDIGKDLRATSVGQLTERTVPDQTIVETARDIHAVLGDWREAERQAAAVPAGSPGSKALARRIDRLREEYRQAYEAAREESGTPDWPDDPRPGA